MKRKFFGAILIVVSFLLVSLNTFKLTGGVVGVFSLSLNLIALTFLILGLALSIRREPHEGNLATQILKSGAVETDSRKLRRIAKESGYEIVFAKEGYQILDKDRKPLTIIPYHHITTGVSKEIIKSLSTGISVFRLRRQRYHDY